MTYNLFLLSILLFPGVLAHHYYQAFVKKEEVSFGVISRICIISLFSYVFRGLIGIFQGYGSDSIFIYFDTIDNVVKYILISCLSSFLLINSYIYLEQTILPLWKEKQTKTEDTTHE